MDELQKLRMNLQQCDNIILDALLMRNQIVEEIMEYKERNGLPIIQPEQEERQQIWLETHMEGKPHVKSVTSVFDEIHRNARKIQGRKLFDFNIVLIGFMGAGKSTISEYLSTQFRKETGNTFSNYIREYRIKKSKELLLGTQLKLHQISAQIGYRSACGSAIIRL